MNSDFSKTEIAMDQLHWKIHNGVLFNFTDTTTGASPVVFLIKVGANQLHLRYLVEAGAACPITLREGAATSADGTAKTIVNFNRNSTNTLLSTAFVGPTVTTPGTIIDNDQAGFGTSQGNALSGANFGDLEYVLKPSTSYTLTLTPGTSTTTIIKAVMYEP